MRLLLRSLLIATLCLSGLAQAQDTAVYFAPDPGTAKVEITNHGFALWNTVLSLSISVSSGHIDGEFFQDFIPNETKQEVMRPFALLLADGTVLPASGLKIVVPPRLAELAPHSGASRFSDRIAGVAVVAELEDVEGRLHIIWQFVLRDKKSQLRPSLPMSRFAKSGCWIGILLMRA
jgi:hypothetical protein